MKKIAVSAAVKEDEVASIDFGVNHDTHDAEEHRIVTAANSITNWLDPMVKVVSEESGIKHGSMTTIHDETNTQTIVDRPATQSGCPFERFTH